MNVATAFDNQVSTLLQKGYSEAAGLSGVSFVELINPLKKRLLDPEQEFELDIDAGKLSFVIVVKSELVPTETAMSFVDRQSHVGITKLFPHNPSDFQIIDTESIPTNSCYLLTGIDRGKDSLNITPSAALTTIRQQQRLPLTIDEGVAIVTHYPEFLQKNNCFSLLASRHAGGKRVPAIWINGQQQPNLGWCWDGNPHTWLGSASAERRIS